MSDGNAIPNFDTPRTLGSFALNSVQNVDALTLLRGLPDASVDLVVTSPPYDNLRAYNGYSFDFEPIAHESYRVLKHGGVQVWVVGDATINGSETLTSMRQALYFVDQVGFRMHDTMIWSKGSTFEPANVRYAQVFEYMFALSKGAPAKFNPVMRKNWNAGQTLSSTSRKADGSLKAFHGNGKKHTAESPELNIWTMGVGNNKTTKDHFAFAHPATFPEALAERHILTWSNPGDLVVDYFGGSGTVAKMARNNGRHYITGDISADYCELMRKRLALPFTLPLFQERNS